MFCCLAKIRHQCITSSKPQQAPSPDFRPHIVNLLGHHFELTTQDVFRLRSQWRWVPTVCTANSRDKQLFHKAQWLTIILLGQSRCFPFWQEMLACYTVNTTAEDDSGKKICAPALEDYYECLHHKKEVGADI